MRLDHGSHLPPRASAHVSRCSRRRVELAAKGFGQTKIAKTLQAEGVKSPSRITEAGRVRRERENAKRIEHGTALLPAIEKKWTGDGVHDVN